MPCANLFGNRQKSEETAKIVEGGGPWGWAFFSIMSLLEPSALFF